MLPWDVWLPVWSKHLRVGEGDISPQRELLNLMVFMNSFITMILYPQKLWIHYLRKSYNRTVSRKKKNLFNNLMMSTLMPIDGHKVGGGGNNEILF